MRREGYQRIPAEAACESLGHPTNQTFRADAQTSKHGV
jgi:hypothetical protein